MQVRVAGLAIAALGSTILEVIATWALEVQPLVVLVTTRV